MSSRTEDDYFKANPYYQRTDSSLARVLIAVTFAILILTIWLASVLTQPDDSIAGSAESIIAMTLAVVLLWYSIAKILYGGAIKPIQMMHYHKFIFGSPLQLEHWTHEPVDVRTFRAAGKSASFKLSAVDYAQRANSDHQYSSVEVDYYPFTDTVEVNINDITKAEVKRESMTRAEFNAWYVEQNIAHDVLGHSPADSVSSEYILTV